MIKIRHQHRDLFFYVDHENITPVSEQFRVRAKNKTVILESNRPLFRNKGLRHRRPDWKLIEGELQYQYGLEELSKAIMEVLEPNM